MKHSDSRVWLKQLCGELGRYTVVGGFAFVLDFALLYALTEWGGIHYIVSASISFSAGLVFNYVLSIAWVFEKRCCSNTRLEFFLFFMVGIGGLILTDIFMATLTPLLKNNYMLAKFITVFFVYLWNFFLRRQLLFAQN